MDQCPYCHSKDLFEVACEPPSPHYARLGCRSCKRSLKFLPAPMTPERAAAFVMPFGKFAGKALAEITADPDGVRYLKWLLSLDDLRPNIRRAVDTHTKG